jgi:hypothetical protein
MNQKVSKIPRIPNLLLVIFDQIKVTHAPTSGLYFKHMTIVNDDYSISSK